VDGQPVLQPLQDGNEAADLFGNGNARRSGAGGLRTDVDDVGPVFFEFDGPGEGAVGIRVPAAVGERIGSQVDDPHDQGPLAQFQFPLI
jgi:hypothetical protein